MEKLKLQKKEKFYSHESPIFVKDADIEKILVSNKISAGKRNYKLVCMYVCVYVIIGCLYNDHKLKPLYIMFSKTSTYLKRYDV